MGHYIAQTPSTRQNSNTKGAIQLLPQGSPLAARLEKNFINFIIDQRITLSQLGLARRGSKNYEKLCSRLQSRGQDFDETGSSGGPSGMENERLKGVCHPCEVPSEVGEKSIAEHIPLPLRGGGKNCRRQLSTPPHEFRRVQLRPRFEWGGGDASELLRV